jgi:hypothetical protein
LNQRRIDAKSFCDNSRLDLNRTLLEFDQCHGSPHCAHLQTQPTIRPHFAMSLGEFI